MIREKYEIIKNSITVINDYPKPGILFRDITSLLKNPKAYSTAINLLINRYNRKKFTKVVAAESRGFLFGAPLALRLNIGFVPIRKPGKLPGAVFREIYQLEYGMDQLEIHQDAINSADSILIIDDLLATGGTIEAMVKLIRRSGGNVQDAGFIINLFDLPGATRLHKLGINCYSLVKLSSSE